MGLNSRPAPIKVVDFLNELAARKGIEVTQAQWEAVIGSNPYDRDRSNPYHNRPGMAERMIPPTTLPAPAPATAGARLPGATTTRYYRGISIGFRVLREAG